VNKACLQDQEVLAQANNTLKTTAFDQGLTEKKIEKKDELLIYSEFYLKNHKPEG